MSAMRRGSFVAPIFPVPAAPDDCVACHQADYDREHAGEGYPTTCALCHGVNDWDADFRHDSDFFPIGHSICSLPWPVRRLTSCPPAEITSER